MKKTVKISCMLLTAGMLLSSCSKFDDINTNPIAASPEQVQIEYFINNSIISAQMNPHIAERAFVLYWKTAGRQHSSSGLATGGYNDGWSNDYYNDISSWLNYINTAIQVAADKEAVGAAKPYDNNLVQVARIWRAYLMSEMSDNFGPIAINAFSGVNPEFADTKAVYYFMLDELKDATAKLDLSIANPSALQNLDPAYKYNYSNWKKYGNSLRLRLAMRLSEVDATKAKTEFEDAASSIENLITTMDATFQVQEKDGWDALSGVMSRTWNTQPISATLYNLYVGLGGVSSQDQLGEELHGSIKPENWRGLRFANHLSTMTNDPSAGFWLDGLPAKIDPRAYKTFIIPGDQNNSEFTNVNGDASITKRNLVDAGGAVVKEIEAKYTYNARTPGSWGTKGTQNQVSTFEGTMPRLANRFRTSRNKRIFFAPWETYFLLAEASVRGWTVPIAGKAAYEAGIRSSFEYSGTGDYLNEYLVSQDYNRAGTSVSWDHTTEPSASVTMNAKDGYTGADIATTFTYAKNDLYKNGTVKNDLLTKIITQKFIAQTPWLPLETWSDHRRLGLPFFENPVVENPIATMPALTASNYMTSSVKFFPQRLKYPSGLANSNPTGYSQAVGFLGGPDEVLTPLWWAKKQ